MLQLQQAPGWKRAPPRAFRDLGFFLSSAALVASGGGRTCARWRFGNAVSELHTAGDEATNPVGNLCRSAGEIAAALLCTHHPEHLCAQVRGKAGRGGFTICRVPPVIVALAAALVSFLWLMILVSSCGKERGEKITWFVGAARRRTRRRRTTHKWRHHLPISVSCGQPNASGWRAVAAAGVLQTTVAPKPHLLELLSLLQLELLGLDVDATCAREERQVGWRKGRSAVAHRCLCTPDRTRLREPVDGLTLTLHRALPVAVLLLGLRLTGKRFAELRKRLLDHLRAHAQADRTSGQQIALVMRTRAGGAGRRLGGGRSGWCSAASRVRLPRLERSARAEPWQHSCGRLRCPGDRRCRRCIAARGFRAPQLD